MSQNPAADGPRNAAARCYVGMALERLMELHHWNLSAFAEKCRERGMRKVDPGILKKYLLGWRYGDRGRTPEPETIEAFSRVFPELGDTLRKARLQDIAEREAEEAEAARVGYVGPHPRKAIPARSALEEEMLDAVRQACEGRPPAETTALLALLRGFRGVPLAKAVHALGDAAEARKHTPGKGSDEASVAQ